MNEENWDEKLEEALRQIEEKETKIPHSIIAYMEKFKNREH